MYRGDAAVYENIAENLRYLRASRDRFIPKGRLPKSFMSVKAPMQDMKEVS